MVHVFDNLIRRKTRLIALVTALGFAVLPGILYFGWPHADGYSPSLALVLRWICVALSFLLALMVYDRERAIQAVQDFRWNVLLVNRRQYAKSKLSPEGHEKHLLKSATRTLARQHRAQLHFSGVRTVFRNNPFLLFLMLICMLCPYPAMEQWSRNFANDKFGLLMVLRVPMVGVWLIHDDSKVFRARDMLGLNERTYLSADHLIALRSLNRTEPFKFIMTFFVGVTLFFSYALWVLERDDSEDGLDIYPTCLSVTLLTIIFKWPDDSWFTHEPVTSLGKLCTAFSSISGILLIFMLLEVCWDTLTPNPEERCALNFLSLKDARRRERVAAARVIQYHWRYQRSIARIMEEERAETLKARVLDHHQARRLSQLSHLTLLARQQGDLEDEMEISSVEPLLNETRSSNKGQREMEVIIRYQKFWEEDAASYKVRCDQLRKELRKAHRKRLELEPTKIVKKGPTLEVVIRRAVIKALQEAVGTNVEKSLSRHLNTI